MLLKPNGQIFVPSDFTSNSTYNLNFIDWKYYDPKCLKPKYVETVVPNQKSVGNSIYQDSFKGDAG